MRQRKPLERRRSLATTTGLSRSGGLARSAGPASSGPTKSRRRDTGPTRSDHETVRARFGGRCARCGGPGHSVQHRQPRQAGGTSDPAISRLSNLVWLCGDGTTGCHGAVESRRSEAYADGYLVRRPLDPLDVAILLWDGRKVYLDDLGSPQPFARPGSAAAA